jgi:hypothetical protein
MYVFDERFVKFHNHLPKQPKERPFNESCSVFLHHKMLGIDTEGKDKKWVLQYFSELFKHQNKSCMGNSQMITRFHIKLKNYWLYFSQTCILHTKNLRGMAKYVLVCQKPTKYCKGCKITSKYGREKMRKGERKY